MVQDELNLRKVRRAQTPIDTRRLEALELIADELSQIRSAVCSIRDMMRKAPAGPRRP